MAKNKKKQKSPKKKTPLQLLAKQDKEEEEIEVVESVVSSGSADVKLGDMKIIMVKELYEKLIHYALAASGEISGLGMCNWKEGEVRITELFLLKQECTGASTELDDEDVSKLMVDLIKKDRNAAELRFWWHSHSSMGKYRLTA